MIRKPDSCNTFGYKPEEGLNPNVGLMSFQHFNGEELYSDIVVHPKNNFCETENVECYPIPDDVPQNGREEGYHPDSSVVYIRALWKEFEPERGVYNYKFIEDILEKARAHKQLLLFRLIAHSTRASDDVPEWLKEIMDCPERPEGKRVKASPTDPRFLEYFGQAIRKIGERFDDDPYFDAIDISLPGSWGEGYKLELYPDEDIRKLIDTYTDVFKKTQLIGQLARPEMVKYASKNMPAGWRGDGLGHPPHTKEIYPPRIAMLEDRWKIAPVSFEAYWWLGEWKRQGWEIDEIIEKTLEWHISSFNAKSIPIPYEWKEKVEYWISKMGYHFMIDYFRFPSAASKGDELIFELGIENCGVAPIYKNLPLRIRLKNDKHSYEFSTDIDIKKWLPGKHENAININLPQEIEAGKYEIEIGIFDNVIPPIYFCTDAKRNDEYYAVGCINIE
jgi:hypothetical protein